MPVKSLNLSLEKYIPSIASERSGGWKRPLSIDRYNCLNSWNPALRRPVLVGMLCAFLPQRPCGLRDGTCTENLFSFHFAKCSTWRC